MILKKIRPSILALGASAAVVVAFAVGAIQATAATQGESAKADAGAPMKNGVVVEHEAPALDNFPTNAFGQTYGSDAYVEPEKAPDLIAVAGDHGKFGYVYRDELNGPEFQSPEDALRWQGSYKADVLVVYAQDGKTKVDTFTLAPTEVSMTWPDGE